MLFLQGTRDHLAHLELMRGVCAKLPKATLKVIDGADHGFDVLKRSGWTVEEVMDELAHEAACFLKGIIEIS
jgi:predicted alpha/beta-hydrolase family hydrolase